MEKLYTHVSYIFLYFFFSSLLTTLLLKKVLSSLASKNKQNIPPSLQTKSSGERLIASRLGIFIFTLHGGVLNTSPTILVLLLIDSGKPSSISVYFVFQGTNQWVDRLMSLPLQARFTTSGQYFMSRFK